MNTDAGGWLPAEPAAPTSFTNIGTARTALTFAWDITSNIMLLAIQGSTITVNEGVMDGSSTDFTYNTAYNLATEQGLGARIVYMGDASNAQITGLLRNTAYSFALYSYSGSVGQWNFNLSELTILNKKTSN